MTQTGIEWTDATWNPTTGCRNATSRWTTTGRNHVPPEIRDRLRALEDERLVKIQELAKLEIPVSESPPQAIELLDELPVIDFEPDLVPEASLRHLFEALRLQVRYDKLDNQAQCRVTLSDDGIDAANENDAVTRAVASGKT